MNRLDLSVLDAGPWQMTPGERAALEGLLCQVKPRLAVEIGTAEGGSLRSIAKHSDHVHSFDLIPPPLKLNELSNVTVHTGDSHVLLPRVLAEFTRHGLNVDFALVDGDHTADGVERDLRDLLASEAVSSTVIVFHDTMNDEVRAGLARVDAAVEEKIAYCDPNFLAGRLHYGDSLHHQLWGGLGLIVVETENTSREPLPRADHDAYTTYELVAPVRDALIAHEQSGEPAGPGRVLSALPTPRSGDQALRPSAVRD
jgi:Methyltransferase domain